MPILKLRDNKTGEIVKVQWNDPDPPTQEDIAQIFLEKHAPQIKSFNGQPVQGEMAPVPEWGVKNPRLYGAYGAAKELGKAGLEMGGLIAGGAGGAVMGGVPGAAAMGGLGYAGAKMLERRLEGEQLKIEPSEFVGGAAMELIPRPVGAAMKWAGRKMIPTAEDFALGKLYSKFKVAPLPSETKSFPSKTLAVLESVLGYSPFSGDVMTRNALEKLGQYNEIRASLIEQGASEKQIERIGSAIQHEAETIIKRHEGKSVERTKQLVDDFMEQFTGGTTKYEAGTTVEASLRGVRLAKSNWVKSLYSKIDDMLGGQNVTTFDVSPQLTAKAEELLKIEQSKATHLQDAKIINILNDWIPKKIVSPELEEQIASMPASVKEKNAEQLNQLLARATKTIIPKFTWTGLDKSRSALLQKAREALLANKGMPTSESMMMSEMAEAIDTEMGAVGEKIGGGVGEAILEARGASKSLHDIFDKDVLGIMNKNPTQVVNVLARDPQQFLKIQQAIGKEGMVPIKQAYISDTINRAMNVKSGFIDGFKIKKAIADLAPEVRNGLLTVDDQAALNGLAESAGRINRQFTPKGRTETLRFLNSIIGTKNENVLNAIFNMNNARNIKMAKQLFTPERLKEITEMALRKVLVTSPEGNILPVQSARLVRNYATPLKELLPEATHQDLNEFITVIQHSKKIEQLAKNASQTGQVFVGFQIGQQLMKSPVMAIKTLGMPWILAKMYVSTPAREYLKRALLRGATSAEATTNFLKAFEIAILDLGGNVKEPGTPNK